MSNIYDCFAGIKTFQLKRITHSFLSSHKFNLCNDLMHDICLTFINFGKLYKPYRENNQENMKRTFFSKNLITLLLVIFAVIIIHALQIMQKHHPEKTSLDTTGSNILSRNISDN